MYQMPRYPFALRFKVSEASCATATGRQFDTSQTASSRAGAASNQRDALEVVIDNLTICFAFDRLVVFGEFQNGHQLRGDV